MTANASRLIIERPYPVIVGRPPFSRGMEHREKLQPFGQLALVVGSGFGEDQSVEVLRLQPVRHKRADDAEFVASNSSRRLIRLAGVSGRRDEEDARSR